MVNEKNSNDDRIVITIIDDDETPKMNKRKKTTPAPKKTNEASKNKNNDYKNNDKQDMKKAKKILSNRTGRFFLLKTEFQNEAEEYGLTLKESRRIKEMVKKEIDNGKLKSQTVDDRIDYLLSNYKELRKEYDENRIKYIEELFETEEIKHEIKIYELTEPRVSKIKKSLKDLITTDYIDKYSEKEIKILAQQKLNEERNIMKEEERKSYKSRWLIILKKLIFDSCPDIILTDKETTYIKNHVDHNELNGSVENMQNQLDQIAKKVISNREKLGKFASTGTLIEDGGFKNANPAIIDAGKRKVIKAKDVETDVFIKIKEDRIVLVETFETDYFSPNSLERKRMIFFNDIVFMNKGYKELWNFLGTDAGPMHDRVIYKSGIEISFINQEKIKIAFEKEGTDELLYNAWVKFKENQENKSSQDSNTNIGEDILKYAELYEKGLLTKKEFTALKKKLLGL